MNPIDNIFHPTDEGKHFVIANGRSFSDITVDNENRLILLNEYLRSEALRRKYIMVEYSKAEGVMYDLSQLNRSESEEVVKVLSDYGIGSSLHRNSFNGDNEFATVIRGILRLAQAAKYPQFRDGNPMRFLIIIKFAEDLMPNLQAGTHSEDQIIAIELCTILSRSLALRKNGSYVLIREEREGTIDSLLMKNIPVLRLPQPDEDEKSNVLIQLKKKYPDAVYTDEIDDNIVLNSAKNSPNRVTDLIFLASSKTKRPINSKDLFSAKQDDLIARSEKTLEPVDTERVKGVNLSGRNISRVLDILLLFTDSLKRGKASIRNLMMAGAPSTGKTDLAVLCAKHAGILACFFNPPKNSLVGESERLTRVGGCLIKENGGLYIMDEVEKIFPMDSGTKNLDSGVSDYIMGYLQSLLSDSSLAGKSAFLATTNNPHKISESMASRWVMLPVLQSLKEDYPSVIRNLAKSINPEISLDIDNKDFIEACDRFHMKGASPREIKENLITSEMFIPEDFGLQHIIYSSYNVMESGNRKMAYNYSDLIAISMCTNLSFLPWIDVNTLKPDLSYPFPDYIQDILTHDGYVDRQKLFNVIKQLQPFVNV